MDNCKPEVNHVHTLDNINFSRIIHGLEIRCNAGNMFVIHNMNIVATRLRHAFDSLYNRLLKAKPDYILSLCSNIIYKL